MAAWTTFRRAGLTPPADLTAPTEKAAALETWCAVLADLDDDMVRAAALRHLRAGDREASFWPKPGRLLALVTDPGDSSGSAAFGRLLRLAQRHGSTARPLHPDAPEPYRLAAPGLEEQARCLAVEAAGGWVQVCTGDRHEARGRYIARHAAAQERYRAHFDREQENPRRAQLRSVGLDHLAPWHRETDPVRAWEEVEALADRYGADAPPLMHGERDGFRLDGVPAIERAMWQGLEAIGGWDRLVSMQTTDEDGSESRQVGFDRHTFATRYEATFERARQDGEYRPGAVIDLSRRIAQREQAAIADRRSGGAR